MKRLVALSTVLAGLVVAGVLVRQAEERDREYQRLIGQGEQALSQGQGQTFVAIEAFSGAAALKPDSMLAFLKRGEAHERRGDPRAALRDLRMASQLDPGATRVLEQLGDANDALRRYTRAAESYEAYIRLDDQSPTVFYKLALASRSDGRPGRAVAALEQAVKLNDRFAEAHYLLGLCLRESGRPVEARAALERAVSLSPALIPAREELADLERSERRQRAEIEQLEALAALDPGRAERLIAVGLAYARAGNAEPAVMTLGRASERFPDQPGVYAALGEIWLKTAEERGDEAALRKALEALEPVASQSAASSETLVLYGRALILAGDIGNAERVLRQAAEKLPTDPSALIILATAAERLGHVTEARDALIRYVLLTEEDERGEAARAERIGDLSLQINDATRAVSWYQRAIDLSEPRPALLGSLADAQSRTGQSEAARATLAQALEKDPSDPAIRAVARRLQLP